jgi:hypothetical protein
MKSWEKPFSKRISLQKKMPLLMALLFKKPAVKIGLFHQKLTKVQNVECTFISHQDQGIIQETL